MGRLGKVDLQDSPYLGLFSEWGVRGSVHYPGPKNLLTFGPPGSGKTTSILIPNIAALRRSCAVIVDPKAQIAAVTLRARKRLGPVLVINPCEEMSGDLPHLKDDGWNPLPTLDPQSARYPLRCFAIADAFVQTDGGERMRFFELGSKNLMSVMIMWERKINGAKANLLNVRRALTAPTVYGKDGKPESGFLRTLFDMASCDYEPIANPAGRLVERFGDTRSQHTSAQDVIDTLAGETRWLDDPPFATSLSGNGFDFKQLRGPQVWTVYVILGVREIEKYSGFLRLVVSEALNALYETPTLSVLRAMRPIYFFLEEFAALGRLSAIEAAIKTSRDYKIVLWPFLQDYGQLSVYPRPQEFLTSAGAISSFAPKDWDSAELLSKICGLKTEIVESENVNERTQGRNRTPQGFSLYRPEELRRMPHGQMLCMVEPEPMPFITTCPPYPDTSFGIGLDENPYFQPDAAE
jgi:type IV secretion system protein VirD4